MKFRPNPFDPQEDVDIMVLSHRKAIIVMMGVILIWSTNGFLIKLISINPLAITGLRSTFAAISILVYLRKIRSAPSVNLIGGAIAFSAAQFLWISATKLTTSANAIFLQLTAPIYVVLFSSWFLNEKATAKDWLATVAVISGMTLFFGDKLTTAGFWGNICGIGSGIGWAWFILFMRKQRDQNPVDIVLWGNILCAVAASPFVLTSMPVGIDWLWLILLGTIGAGLSYALYAAVIRRIPAIEVVVVQTIEPVLNPIWVFLILGEIPGSWAMLGAFIVLSTVTVHAFFRSRTVVAST